MELSAGAPRSRHLTRVPPRTDPTNQGRRTNSLQRWRKKQSAWRSHTAHNSEMKTQTDGSQRIKGGGGGGKRE